MVEQRARKRGRFSNRLRRGLRKMLERGKALPRLASAIADDLLVLGGCGLILYGTYLVYPIAAWFVGGVMCIALGVLIGAGGKDDHS